MGQPKPTDTPIAPIVFAAKQVEQPKQPDKRFDELSAVDKQAMLVSLKASLDKTRDAETGDQTDIAPLLRNIEDLVNGVTTDDMSATAFGNKFEVARANLRNQISGIDPAMYPPCDDRMTVKLPKSAKKHLMTKALEQDMTLSEYVIQSLNIVGELEGDEKIVLVAPRGHFLQRASLERAKR